MLKKLHKSLFISLLLCLFVGLFAFNINVQADTENQTTAVGATQLEIVNHTFPTNLKERDQVLSALYNTAIPKLLSWALSNIQPKSKLVYSLLSQEDISEITDGLLTPMPFAPYRSPNANQRLYLPSNAEEWEIAIKHFSTLQQFHTQWLSLCQNMLKAANANDGEILLSKATEESIRSQLTRPSSFIAKDILLHRDSRESMFIKNPNGITLAEHKLTSEEKRLIQLFIEYHEAEIKMISNFLQEFSSAEVVHLFDDLSISSEHVTQDKSQKRQAALQFMSKIRPYFLGGRKPAHKLINVESLQGKSVSDAEVIVFDPGHVPSRHLNYSPLSEFHKDVNPTHHQNITPSTHSTAVAGIIGANEELQQIKGVAPGAQILTINTIEEGDREKINHSSARVINLSQIIEVPQKCGQYFNHQQTKSSKEGDFSKFEFKTCRDLWELFNLVINKDLLLVISAGNNGVQLERVDLQTGQYIDDLTNHARNVQYDNLNPGLIEIAHQVPHLLDRLIVVGNLKQDGVTIHKTSNLPGALYDHFIFAPSEDILSLYESAHPLKDQYVGELGKFGGSSGAAPRVSGVAVLLGRKFPRLKMPQIKSCILKTGTPFWNDPNNKFDWLKPFARTTEGKRIYGNGRIDAMAAYQCCLDLNNKQSSSVSTSALNLEDNSKAHHVEKIKKSISTTTELLNAIKSDNFEDVKDYYEGTYGQSAHPYTKIYSPISGTFQWPWQIALQAEKADLVVYLSRKAHLSKDDANALFFQHVWYRL